MSHATKAILTGIVAATLGVSFALAAQPDETNPTKGTPPGQLSDPGTGPSDSNLLLPTAGMRPAEASDKMTTAKSFPTKNLQGLNVRNAQGEKLGVVDDLVVNLESGKVSYVVLSVGGVLGIGDNLFAIPIDKFKFNYGPNENTFVLNISKQRVEGAPGFDRDHWPDFADPQWRNKVDTYYRASASPDPAIDRTLPTGKD